MSKIIGNEIPKEVQDYLNGEEAFMVLATINSEDGFPHTTPINLFKVPNEKTIYMSIAKGHQAYENIKNDPRIMLSLLAGNDMAMSFKGKAKVIKEPMDGNEYMVGIQIDIIEVKSDTTATVKVEKGIEVSQRSQKTPELFRKIYDELKYI